MVPDLPPELWHKIFECTCTCDADNNNDHGENKYRFDCPTSRTLANTSSKLWQLSQPHRFHSIAIRGWKQLLAFEELYNSARTDSDERSDGQSQRKYESSIVYLHVELPQLWNDVYPPTDDDHDDGSETGSEDTFAVGSSDSEGSGEDDDSDESSDVEDQELAEERAYEFTEMTDADWAEVSEDLTALAEEKQQGEAGGCFDKTYNAHELSFLLASSSTPLARMEFVVYSALRRLLEACAPTLKVLSLSWNPISTFFIEAVFPLLPQLRVLRWDRDKSDYSPLCGNLSVKRRAPAPHVFPALHHLDIKSNNTHNEVSGLLLMCPDVRLISVSQDML